MQPESNPRKTRRLVSVAIIVVILAVALAIVALEVLQPQPNIQITQTHFEYDRTPSTSNVVNYGYIAYDRINQSQQFEADASSPGTYDLVFDNSLSFTLTEGVSVTYAYPGYSNSESFQVGPGDVKVIEANLTGGQKFSGTFTVSGGALDDTVKVYIDQTTCLETVTYSYVLVNAGSVGGFASIGLQTNHTISSNKYFVAADQQLPESGSIDISQPFCNTQQAYLVVMSQQKG